MLLRHTRRSLPAALVALLVGLVALPVGGAGAASYKTCTLSASQARHLGATYVTKLKVRGTSCSNGRAVAKAFNACRHDRGLAGTCSRRVKGYKCSEKRPPEFKLPTSFDADVTCSSGTKRVRFHYQQNT